MKRLESVYGGMIGDVGDWDHDEFLIEPHDRLIAQWISMVSRDGNVLKKRMQTFFIPRNWVFVSKKLS